MEQEQKKRRLIITVIGVIAVIIALSGIVYSISSPSKKLRVKLDLGHQYLNELHYEQAIAVFKEALDLDPSNAEAREALISAYLDWADQLLADGDTDKAMAILTEGYEYLNDSRLQDKMKSINADTSTENKEADSATETVNLEEKFADIIVMAKEYDTLCNRCDSLHNADWAEIFLTADEIEKAYEPLIKGLEEYLKYCEENNIDERTANDILGISARNELRRCYIITRQFDKSAQLTKDIYSNLVGHDEYGRIVHSQQENGNETTFVWGEDGWVTSYTSTLTDESGEKRTETNTFEYDNGRIVSMHVTITGGPGTSSHVITYTYEGDTVTTNYGPKTIYRINKYGRGEEIYRGE